ncbi:MAG: hypothetical protein O6844_02245, partial [Gammaproteobacteria bacterium]|nr:hypothetical protein [Gammaproteobacteria bacterium]
MRKSTFFSTALLACCCAFVLSAGSAAAPNCEKKPDHPRCNGGGEGGGDHPVNLTFRDGSTDNIRSDAVPSSGTVTYTDGEPGVSARIRDDGMLLFNIDDPNRGLELNFSDQSLEDEDECGGGGCKNDFDNDNITTA